MKVRQDAWSHEDDLLLAETVLRHIREGSTQLRAFDEVGDKLNRTSAAVGFRWNAIVRQKYEQAIQLAKKQRKERKRMQAIKTVNGSMEKTSETKSEQSIDLEDVINFLTSLKNNSFQSTDLKAKTENLQKENERLRNDNERLKNELKKIEQQYATIQEDYQSLIQIMERARKMVVFQDSEEQPSTAFKMDKNGNLEKIAK